MKTKLFYLFLFSLSIAYSQIPTTNLVGQYDFSNGALTDAVNNVTFTKTGTAATTITDRFGNINEAISLNGDGLTRPDINFNNTLNANPYKPQTISFWLKTGTNDTNSREIYNDNDRTALTDLAFSGLRVYLQNGKITAAIRDNGYGGNYFTHTTDISNNGWHHIVVQAYLTSISGTEKLITYIYINGIKQGGAGVVSGSLSIYAADYTGNMSFSGLGNAAIPTANNKYQDGIDEILFYKKLLSDAEIAAIGSNNGYTFNAYVNPTATGNNDGTTWANAYTSLTDALNNSNVSNDIWVAKGTYKPSASDRDASFIVNSNIYGGFVGTEVNLSDRNLNLIHTTNATILSGDLLSDDDATVDFNDTTRGDNSKHVVEIATNNLKINGLTIQDGYADAISGDDRFGAGIFKIQSVANMTLKNCRLKNNVALSGAGLSLTVNDTSNIIIDACIIENNLANEAAGLDFHMNSTNKTMDITVTNSLFNGNKTLDDATKGRKGSGAAAVRLRSYWAGVVLNAKLVNNTFVNNSSLGDSGSSVAGNFPVIDLSKRNGDWGAITIANNLFWDNITHSNQVAKAIGKSHNLNIPLQGTDSLRLVENNTDEDNLSTFINLPLNTSSINPNLDVDFKLTSGSQAIDTGANNKIPSGIIVDLQGNQRIFNTTVDRGAYEHGATLGVEDNVLLKDFKLYPNPVINTLNIKLENTLETVEIYSVLGRKIVESKLTSIDVSSLASGIYLLKIYTQNGKVGVKRFVKN